MTERSSPGTHAPTRRDPRVVRSLSAIRAAAEVEFLRHGFRDASVDAIAARAGVSKRTVYNLYRDKERLFREIVTGVVATAEAFADDVAAVPPTADDIETELLAAARRLGRTVLDERIVALRRLLIAEARRFPQLAREYYERAPGRVMASLATMFQRFDERGVLRISDPELAAEHFAFLVVGAALDRALFGALDGTGASEDLERRAVAGVEAFLRAYAAPG